MSLARAPTSAPVGELAPRGFPMRAFWCWPLGCAFLGAVEAAAALDRIGGGAPAFVLAVLAAAATGLWAGMLGLLVSTLLRRRRVRVPARAVAWLGELTTPLLASVVFVAVAWRVVEQVHALFEVRHLDFVEESIQVWRGAFVLAVPPAVVVCWLLMRRLEHGLRAAAWRPWAGRVAMTGLVGVAVVHFCAGPFSLHFGAALAFALLGGCVVACAVWLPATLPEGRRAAIFGLGPAVPVLVLGVVGLRTPSSRALLLHDARVFPEVHAAAFAFLDRDGDGEGGRWAGGPDCDDDNPSVASWHPELPGNGVDDNCHAGDLDRVPPGESEPPATSPRHVPVFLITLDTIRADRLAGLGSERDTMPYLREYAERARWFVRAYAPSNHTGFSIIDILSGQGPELLIADEQVLAAHGRKFTAWLPHALRELGYETWAINPILVGTDLSLDELRFDHHYLGPFEHTRPNRGTRAGQLADWVVAFVAADPGTRPRFHWIHIGDAHAAHEAHEHFPVASTLDAYDNELRWVDRNLGAMLRAIHTRYGEQVVVVITSDHGEEFGERGAYGHGFSLRESMLRVPLLVRAPGLEAGIEVRPTNVAGLAPAIVQAIGEQPSSRMTVPSVLDPREHPVVVGAPFFLGERRMEVALIESRFKLTVNRSTDTRVLVDLELDPEERHNLVCVEPEQAARMEARLRDALERLR